ncbi:MerR family DNA-binding transcriptional regulator [Paraconexibacter algicola]|nr:MerR family DNA-binding transcriptional regulator [Paraconexibacter algicola]
MRTLKTSEAAALLNVSPNTLRAWERRFGYPRPMRSPGKHRLYTYGEVVSLRDALNDGLSISSAISRAREAVRADTHVLLGALLAFDRGRADEAMEAALALRPLERAVEEVMLPSLEEIVVRDGADSAPWAFATAWAAEWVQRARRITPTPARPVRVLVGDATSGPYDRHALSVRTLELCTARAGALVITLPVSGVPGLGKVLASHEPDAVVLAGAAAPDDDVARWAYAIRSAVGALPMLLFHREVRGERVSAAAGRTLDERASVAARQVVDAIAQRERSTTPVAPGSTPRTMSA